jgi:hypothetical protein
MNLNPVTALIKQLEKLINEHASAAVLRDHLALFKDQLLILEKENVKLASENSVLTTTNEKLVSENKNLRIANDELASKIKEYENPPHKKDLLDEPKIKILTLLGQYSTDDEIDADSIAAQCNLPAQATQFHLEELQDSQLIRASYYVGRSPTWYIIQEGRRYLMTRGLL